MLLNKITYLGDQFWSDIKNIVSSYNKSLINVFELFEKVKVLKNTYIYITKIN